MPQWTEQDREHYRQLMGLVCWCGNAKTKAKSHCFDCYRRLPSVMQRKLYSGIGAGYAEAYDASVEWLKSVGVTAK